MITNTSTLSLSNRRLYHPITLRYVCRNSYFLKHANYNLRYIKQFATCIGDRDVCDKYVCMYVQCIETAAITHTDTHKRKAKGEEATN